MGSREKENVSFFLRKSKPILEWKTVYVNQSEIAKDFELIENKVFCFVLISAFLLAYFCLCAVYLSGLIVH